MSSRPKRKSAQREPYSENEDDVDTRVKNEPRSNKPAAVKAARTQRGASSAAGPSNAAPAASAPGSAAQTATVDNSDSIQIRVKVDDYQQKAHQKLLDSKVQITAGELDSLVGKLVRHMLFKAHEEPDKPVSRNHLVELVKSDYKEHKQARKLPSVVIAQAQAKIIAAFGYEMRELEHHHQEGGPKSKEEEGGSGQYVLRSLLPAHLRELCMVQPAREQAKHALTMTVLALIHMSGGKLDEEELWSMLGKLGVRKDTKELPRLGGEDPKALIDRLEKIKFLHHTRRQDHDVMVDVYEWGDHARDHISQEEIKEFINKELSQAAEAEQE